MKKFYLLPLLLLSFVCVYIACKKTDAPVQNPAPKTTSLIESAQAYFKAHIQNNTLDAAQRNGQKNKVPKAAAWGKAFTKKFSIGDVVIVPLDYGEHTYLHNKISGDRKLFANQVSSLLMYKDAQDSFHTEVVTSIPDSNYVSGNTQTFSGTILVHDWQDTALKAFKYTDNKVMFLKAGHQIKGARFIADCYDIDWYNCTDTYGCIYYQTTDGGCFYYDDGTGGGGDPGGGPSGDDYAGVHDGGNNTPSHPTDPCTDAQPGAENATSLSQSSVYSTAKSNIQAAASDGQEHTVTFGKDANGNITASPINNTGGSSSGNVNSNWPGAFADIHNHPDEQPPSPGDMYTLISKNKNNSGYNTRFVVTPDGSVYALLIVNAVKASSFVNNHSESQVGNYPPDFPDPLFTDFNNTKIYFQGQGFNDLIAEEKAMALVLDKYDSGVALLKQDSNGNFKKLGTTETVQNGNIIYTSNNCQ